MKLVNKSILAVIITAVCAPAFATDSVETAATELQAINSGMSHGEIDQKINRFMLRTGMTNQDATDYLINHGYQDEHGNTIYPTTATAEPGQSTPTHTTKIEATENVTGSPLKRTMINHMERREAEQHESRFTGMTHERSIYDVLDEEHEASRATYKKPQAAPVVPGSKLDNVMKGLGIQVSDVGVGTGEPATATAASVTALQGTVQNHQKALVAESQIVNTVQHDVSNLQHSTLNQHQALVTVAKDVNNLQTSAQNQHQALVHAAVAINEVKGDVSALETTVYKHQQALVSAGKEIDSLNENAIKTTDKLDKVSAEVAGNTAGIKTNADDISKVSRIADQQQNMLTSTTAKTDGLAAQSAIQNSDRVQGMLHAKQEAEIKAAVLSVKPSTVPADHSSEITANRTAIKSTQRDVKALTKQQHITSVQYGEQIQNLAKNAAGALNEQADAINSNSRSIRATRSQVSDNTQSINKLNGNFSSLKNQVDDNRKEANAGTASAMAFASQPQVKTGDSMMVSAGAGTFNGESAVSVGASFNAGEHTVIKVGATADTQSDFGAGAGIGYSF